MERAVAYRLQERLLAASASPRAPLLERVAKDAAARRPTKLAPMRKLHAGAILPREWGGIQYNSATDDRNPRLGGRFRRALNHACADRLSLRRGMFDFVSDRMAKESSLNISWNADSVRDPWPVASRSNCSPRTAASAKVAKACACSRATATANARSTSGSHSPTAPFKNPGNRSRFWSARP